VSAGLDSLRTAYGELLEKLMDLGLKYRAQWRASYG